MYKRLMFLVLPASVLLLGPVGVLADDSPGVSTSSDLVTEKSFGVRLVNARRLLEIRDYRAAARELKQLVKRDEKNADVWRMLGIASHKKGDFLGAKIAFEKSLKLKPDNKKVLGLQAELFLSIGDRQSARSNLERLRELCPDGCDSRKRIATALDLQ